MRRIMKIVSWNVNGLRSIVRKNCIEQIFRLDPDIICFQETKLSDESIFTEIVPSNYTVFNHLSMDKGRNGVCIISKLPVSQVLEKIGHDRFDSEGRYLSVKLENGWSIVNLYMPHGKRDKTQIPYKLDVAKALLDFFQTNKTEKRILCTDFNIAHKTIDLCRAKENRNNTMFTVEERAIVDSLLDLGFVDAFRKICGETGYYTWWPYGFQARERNIGWRIDYFFVNEMYQNNIIKVDIKNSFLGSDHCPMIMEIDT